MSRSRSPDLESNDLPNWLKSRDVSSIGRPKLQADLGPAAPEHTLLTVPEVAESLRVSTRTVRRWIASGTLQCVRIGRVVRVPAEVVNALIRPGKTA